MKEVGRLLSIRQLTTTPYYPQCNGLVERFNGTLKTMLKRMCSERPRDWDRYINALLFAYREAPQESLGFAPFDMLYGRSVKGPLRILRQLRTREQSDPDGTKRVCVDYRKLNCVTVFDPEPMPTAEEIFAKLSGDRFFWKFDLSKGYWQVPVCEEDRDFTTFISHRGLFRFRVMPFGLVNAPATFSRLMRRVLRNSQNTDNYLDDVLAHTPD